MTTHRPAIPPPMPPPSFKPRWRLSPRARRIMISVVVLLAVLIPLWFALRDSRRQATHADVLQLLQSRIELDHRDSMMAGAWQAGLEVDKCKFALMSFHKDSKYVKEFLSTIPAPVSALAMMVDNSAGQNAHTVDFTGARLYFDGNVMREAPDQLQLLQSVSTDRAAAMEAFAPTFEVRYEKIVWGKLLLIPADIDLRKLLAVAIKIDGRVAVFEGGYLTAAQKELAKHGIIAPTITTAPTTAPASAPTTQR